jgi:hypothetical protein
MVAFAKGVLQMDEKTRKVSRRSFLGQVAGGAAGVGALAVIGGSAAAAEDHDMATNIGPAPAKPGTGSTDKMVQGCSDSDTGRYADGIGHGRRCRPTSGCSDSDTGRYADGIGHGRRCSSNARRPYTGYSDSDSGPGADPRGHGRPRGHRGGCTDTDNGRYSDSPGHGRRC